MNRVDSGLTKAVVLVVAVLWLLGGTTSLSAQGAEKAADPVIEVTKIVVDDSQILTDAELDVVVGAYEGREATLGDLKDVADKINALYAKKGYITAKALLPPQQVKDGIVHIRLVEGRVGDVAVTGNQYTKDGFFTNRISLKQGALVTLGECSRKFFAPAMAGVFLLLTFGFTSTNRQ